MCNGASSSWLSLLYGECAYVVKSGRQRVGCPQERCTVRTFRASAWRIAIEIEKTSADHVGDVRDALPTWLKRRLPVNIREASEYYEEFYRLTDETCMVAVLATVTHDGNQQEVKAAALS